MNKTFWLYLLIDPFRALDLTDKDGNPDHGKLLPALLLFAAISLQIMGDPFKTADLVILGSLSYGYGAWRSFLRSKTVTLTESRQTSVNVQRKEEILARRDVEAGIDPTYE